MHCVKVYSIQFVCEFPLDVHLLRWEILWRNAPRFWRDFGSVLPFQTRLTQTKPVLPLSNEHGSQVKDQSRRQCCHNKHKNFLYRPTRDISLLSGQVSYITRSLLACAVHQMLFGWRNQANWGGRGMSWYDKMYLLTKIRLTPGGSSTVHIYTQTVHGTTQLTKWERFGPSLPSLCELYPGICLTTEEKARKNSVRVAEECQLARWKQNIQNRTYITIRIHRYNNKNT